jgi:hypothetical protein
VTATNVLIVVVFALTSGLSSYVGFHLGKKDEREKQDHLRRVTKKPTTDRIVTSGSSEEGNHAVVHRAHVRRGRITKGL